MLGRAGSRWRTHLSHSWLQRLGIAGCLAAGLVPPPAAAAHVWSHPASISNPEKVVVESLRVLVSSQGGATAVWQLYGSEDGIVKSAMRQAVGNWSAPHKLSEYGTQIALDSAGNMTAIWASHQGRSFVVQSATRPAEGIWSAPVTISRAGAGSTLVAIDPRGLVTAVWLLERDGGNRSVVQSATRSVDGVWSAPVNLSPVKQDACSPQVALDPQGGATVIWEEKKIGAVQSATRSPDGSWSAPVNLSGAGKWVYGPQVAVDSQGNATAVWESSSTKGTLIQSATRPVGGSWLAPVNLSKPAHQAEEAHVAVSPQGEATAIWARSNGMDLVVQGATRPAGGGWSAPVDISAHHGQGGFYPRLVVDSKGDATAVWKGYDRYRHNLAIQAATRRLGGGWSAPTDVSNRVPRHMGISEPQMAIDPQGIATVVWVIRARGGGIVQAATSVRAKGSS
jgi:hypothetical protein